MTQTELIDKVAAETGVTKIDTKMMIDAVGRAISEESEKGGSVKLSELGTFSIAVVSERNIYNPLFGEKMTFPEQKRVRFKPSKGLKDRVNR